MTCQPVEPDFRFVWVRGQGDIGAPTPGVVVAWQHSPVHNVNASDWVALIASCPFGSALLVEWEAQVAIVRPGSVLTTWVPASDLRPIADDHWELPGRSS